MHNQTTYQNSSRATLWKLAIFLLFLSVIPQACQSSLETPAHDKATMVHQAQELFAKSASARRAALSPYDLNLAEYVPAKNSLCQKLTK